MIIILGGTSDSVELAAAMHRQNGDVLLSTATAYGNTAIKDRYPGRCIFGKLDTAGLKALFAEEEAGLVIDATHPYAQQVSANAMAACRDLGIEYVRYERPNAAVEDGQTIWCESYEEAGRMAEQSEGNIFITTGSNRVEVLLQQISDLKRVKVRVLPTSEALLKLEGLGLDADHVIAMKGPFSEEMNILMLRESKAGVLVCKDSGQSGGTEEKLAAAYRLGVKVIMIRRPDVAYGRKFGSISEVLEFCRDLD